MKRQSGEVGRTATTQPMTQRNRRHEDWTTPDVHEIEARRVLADRTAFELDAEGQAAWEEINAGPARTLPGLRKLMDRPSPFIDG